MASEPELTASPILVLAIMLGLATLDFTSAVLAKEWTVQRHPLALVGGACLSLLIFSLFAFGLRFAELSTVTFGWVIVLEVGILLVERLRYGVELPTGKWLAVGGLLLLQAYLILAPSPPTAHAG